jgi:acetylornithine deacetylase/succinyl-diaminopimelate desuccinylase-like protein
VKRLFEELGLRDVRTDSAGNVIGVRPGKSPSPNTVFAAHLDTVFPEGTPVAVKREGALMKAPGISDNARGLAVLLAIIRAFKESGIETAGTLTFVADVGEEGLGDLRGMKTLFNQTLKGRIDRFVSIDGSGLGVTNIGVGSFRYRVVFSGPGGHSYGSFGMANPIHAMGRAIAKIAEFRTPATPRTTFNVGRVGGGASVNSIASEAWMEVDLRSSDETALAALDAKFHAALKDAVDEENRRWNGRLPISVDPGAAGVRPAGRTPRDSAIVRDALAVSRELGFPVSLQESSTDANIPMSLGIPAITIGGGGEGTGSHSPSETFNSAESWRGTQRAFLLALVLAR